MNISNQIDTRRRVINIDSRYREDYINTTPTDFKFTLMEPIKNVCKIRLLTAEIPNTEYSFSAVKKNTNFSIQPLDASGNVQTLITISITDGNYTAANLVDVITTYFTDHASLFTGLGMTPSISLGDYNGKITISMGKKCNFIFGTGFDRPFEFGLGYNLGFRQKFYLGVSSITSESIIHVIGDNYYLLQVDDYGYVQHKTWYKETIRAFAKIPINQDKNIMIFDDLGNQVVREHVFPSPIDIYYFNKIRLCDARGEPVDLQGMNISIALEITEIVNSKTSSSYSLFN
jgi:hypothetical protein